MSGVPSPAGEAADDATVIATAVRAFYSFAIDLSDFEGVSDESLTALQEARANGGLHDLFTEHLTGADGFSWTAEKIRRDGDRAVERKGKRVWSETFRNRARWSVPAPQKFDWDRVSINCGARLTIPNLGTWQLDEVNQFITGDGVLVVTASFRTDSAIEIDALIKALSRMKAGAAQIFTQAVEAVLAEGSQLVTALASMGFTAGSIPKSEKIREHRTTIVDSLTGVGGVVSTPHNMRDSHAVAGLLNLADWYGEYHEYYLKTLGGKEFGYKRSELYLTDRTATLAVQEGFWDFEDPLHFYLGDVLLAVEYHLGVQALLRGQLQYARALYSASSSLAAAGVEAVDDVRRMRAILSGAYESLNYSVLVLHGFTRHLLVGLDRESEIRALLSDVERRVENVSDSVALRASVESSTAAAALQGFGNLINSRVLKATYAAVFIALISFVISVIAFLRS